MKINNSAQARHSGGINRIKHLPNSRKVRVNPVHRPKSGKFEGSDMEKSRPCGKIRQADEQPGLKNSCQAAII